MQRRVKRKAVEELSPWCSWWRSPDAAARKNTLKRQVNTISLHGTEVPDEHKVTRRRRPFPGHDSGAQDNERILTCTACDTVRYLGARHSIQWQHLQAAPTQVTHVWTVSCCVTLHCASDGPFTVNRQKYTYEHIHENTLASAQGRRLSINPSLCRWVSRLQLWLQFNYSTQRRCKRMPVSLFTITVAKNTFFGSDMGVYDNRK